MDIKIDKHGGLWIKRGDRYVEAKCPLSPRNWGEYGCGDWCALFGEPDDGGGAGPYLELCHHSLYGAITDERTHAAPKTD